MGYLGGGGPRWARVGSVVGLVGSVVGLVGSVVGLVGSVVGLVGSHHLLQPPLYPSDVGRRLVNS